MLTCFAPLSRPDARVLILGTMPGEESLRRRQYYAHPRNAFWPILGDLLGFDPAAPYRQRCRHVVSAGLAVWDVLRRCERERSADARITCAEPNDFAAFFARRPRIRAVFLNGATAERLFRQHVRAPAHLRHIQRLPSTSPAMASLSLERKREAWQAVALALRDGAARAAV